MSPGVTERLKAELWRRFGTREHPAEWDGAVSGGGKLSQRYWEYMKALEFLELDASSVLLDLGGGSPDTGAGFFAELVAGFTAGAVVVDPHARAAAQAGGKLELIREAATRESLRAILADRPEITHVACISVFEHIEPDIRRGIVEAINTGFRGRSFVATFEYHPSRTYFEFQLTARTLSDLFRPLANFYPDKFEASPVQCENAFDPRRLLRISRRAPADRGEIPLWYPVAVRFVRSDTTPP